MVLISVLLGAALAQTPAQPPEPVLRSTTRLIQLNVIVRDRHGEPVRGLSKEDFHITDNGKPQQVSVFSMDSNAVLPQAEQLPANTFTNQLQLKSGVPGSVSVILLDSLNSRFEDQAWARQQVIKYLSALQPEDRVGIYALGHGLRVLHDFTTDSSSLLRQLDRYKGEVLPDTAASEQTSFDTDPSLAQFDAWATGHALSGQEADFYMLNRVKGTLAALEFIADHLSGLPGRKNLIWVSNGFPSMIGFETIQAINDPSREHRTFSDEMLHTIRALNDANVAIYPVDSRGLMVDPRFSAANRTVNLAPRLSNPIVENQMTMSHLAEGTGGHAYYNTNDLAKAIREAVNDSALTYTIGFYPADDAFDGKFHKVEVKLPERSGLSLHYRKGYYDIAEQPHDERARRRELQDAVWSPIDASALGLVVQIAPADPQHPNDWNLYLKLNPSGVGLSADNGRHNGKVDLLFVQKDEHGRQFNSSGDGIALALTDESFGKFQKSGFVYHRFVPKTQQATNLRIIARDASSGAVGSVTIPLNQIRL